MKKIIAIAAIAAVGTSFASGGNCTPDAPNTDCALVYSFKASVKTTKGIVRTQSTSGGVCAPGESGCVVLRTKDSTKWEGWIYDCSCSCDLASTGSFVAWDSKRKGEITSATLETEFINVMGKKQNEAEWLFNFTGTVENLGDAALSQEIEAKFAGLGKYDVKKDRYASFSGSFAGKMGASYDLAKAKKSNTDEGCDCTPSQVYACADLDALNDSETVAYGTWTVKYNSSASKKYLKDGSLKVPGYVE